MWIYIYYSIFSLPIFSTWRYISIAVVLFIQKMLYDVCISEVKPNNKFAFIDE